MWQKFVQPTHFKVYIAANSEAHKEPYVHTTTSSWFTLCLLWNTSKLKFWTLHKYVAVASGTEECLVLYEVLTLLDPYTYHQIIFFSTMVFHENQIFWFKHLLCTYLLSSKTITIKWKNWEEKNDELKSIFKIVYNKETSFFIQFYWSLLFSNNWKSV